jgi:hypothetical protein
MAGEKIWQRVKARIASTSNPMPPPARPQLTAQEKQALETWLSGGAKGVAAASCGGESAGPATGATPPAEAGKCDALMEFRAHGGQGENDTTPYDVPSGGDHYEIFYFRPSWTEKMHAVEFTPIVDNGAVLHHWLLYMKESGTNAPGSHASDVGLQSADSQLLVGWAPGNKGFKNPANVGLYTVSAPKGLFGIEIHYNTSSNPTNRKDRSGVRVCLVKPRPNEAAAHWLGTEVIFGESASSDCVVPKEAHIIAHSPHMHKIGKYMKSIIKKKDGSTVTLTDQPFRFDDQQVYPVNTPTGEIVVQPGDVITTTCEYDGFAIFGPGTDEEMCYNFVTAWPRGSLSTGSGIVGGQNTCTGQ